MHKLLECLLSDGAEGTSHICIDVHVGEPSDINCDVFLTASRVAASLDATSINNMVPSAPNTLFFAKRSAEQVFTPKNDLCHSLEQEESVWESEARQQFWHSIDDQARDKMAGPFSLTFDLTDDRMYTDVTCAELASDIDTEPESPLMSSFSSSELKLNALHDRRLKVDETRSVNKSSKRKAPEVTKAKLFPPSVRLNIGIAIKNGNKRPVTIMAENTNAHPQRY